MCILGSSKKCIWFISGIPDSSSFSKGWHRTFLLKRSRMSLINFSTPKRRKLPVRRLSDISYRSIDRTGQGMNPARIYIVYGMSKDLSSNPFQIGALVPQHDPTVVTTSLCPITLAVVSAPAGKSGQTFSAVPESSSKISSRRTKSSYR